MIEIRALLSLLKVSLAITVKTKKNLLLSLSEDRSKLSRTDVKIIYITLKGSSLHPQMSKSSHSQVKNKNEYEKGGSVNVLFMLTNNSESRPGSACVKLYGPEPRTGD